MTNNDVLRRIRFIFDYNDEKMIAIFSLSGYTLTREILCDWLKREEESSYKECTDSQLASFLNGLIIEKRGKKEGPLPVPDRELNNNKIFMKLKIALNLKAEEVLEILTLANLTISKHELSAFFRKPGHKHYRDCQDQVLRRFLKGVQLKFRPIEE